MIVGSFNLSLDAIDFNCLDLMQPVRQLPQRSILEASKDRPAMTVNDMIKAFLDQGLFLKYCFSLDLCAKDQRGGLQANFLAA